MHGLKKSCLLQPLISERRGFSYSLIPQLSFHDLLAVAVACVAIRDSVLISWGFIPRPLGRIDKNLRVNTPLSRNEKVDR